MQRHSSTAARADDGNPYLVRSQERRALIGGSEGLATPTVRWLPSPARLLAFGSSPPIGRQRGRKSDDARQRDQTYGKNRPPSFLHRCAHYSLKIPPKKRRRFSKTYWPLSHVSEATHSERSCPDSAGGRNMAGCCSFCLPAAHPHTDSLTPASFRDNVRGAH